MSYGSLIQTATDGRRDTACALSPSYCSRSRFQWRSLTAGTVDHAVDAGALRHSLLRSSSTQRHPHPSGRYDRSCGQTRAAYRSRLAVPQPTVTHTAAPTDQLVLSDSDDTGLEVVAKALLAASAAATVAGNIFWADADRGGTDTPLDGELGLGAGNTVISRFRRVSATVLVLNDNDNPSAFDIGAYFNTGGGGNDLTLYFQTLSGEVSFSVATQLVKSGRCFRTVHPTRRRRRLCSMELRAVTGLFSRLPVHQRHPQTMPLKRATPHSLLLVAASDSHAHFSGSGDRSRRQCRGCCVRLLRSAATKRHVHPSHPIRRC